MMESESQPSDASEQVRSIEEKPVDPMEVFRRQLEDIINTYGSADSLLEEKISSLEKDEENPEDECVRVDEETSSNSETEQSASVLLEALGEEASVLLQSLKTLPSPEEKVETLLRKYIELLKKQRNEQVKRTLLQKKQGLLVEQRDRLQLEHSRGILARSELEKLCRDLQQHNAMLKEDMLQKCQEDEKKRAEIHSHFHNTVVDIQAQIEQHSSRNNKLSQENIELANKLTSIIQQYEKREESWEKIFKQKELQQQLSDAKLEEANLRLREEEEKHKREKEYLLKEAIDKTKKCLTLKEQELKMKKQLVLYSQKFEEFQATLAKSNKVYDVFKQEMEKMTTNMKKLEKEANMWRIRFESCNKALTEMIEERSEKGKELDLFTAKIDKLETLCRALQEERKILYDKIKEIRLQSLSASKPLTDIAEEEIPDLEQLPVSEPLKNPVLIAEVDKLWKEQERLQAFAASLLASTVENTVASGSEKESSEPKAPVPVTRQPPTVRFQLDSITENHAVEEGIKELQKSDTTLTPEAVEAIQLESNQEDGKPPKAEPPKAEPSKVEPPKEEPPKAEPPKEEPSKAEPPKEEPSKAEPPKEKPSKAEPPKEEPSKAEPPKEKPSEAEPPKEEPSKADPPKEKPSKAEPPKEKPSKADPPKEKPSKADPPKEKPSKAEPPKEKLSKAEPPKAEPPKEKPSKAETPKEELPKAETPKEELPKAETPKEEPSKVEPPKEKLSKVEPPKEEPPKAEPHKEKPSKVEPSKAETPKEEPSKVESPKEEPSKLEPPKDKLLKLPNTTDGEVKPNQQNKRTQKSNKPNSVEHKEPQPEVEMPTAPAKAPQAHTQQEPRAQSSKQASGAEARPKEAEPQEASTAAEPLNPEPQEPKPAANKPQGKKQSSSKRRGAAKGMKKS